MTREKFAESFLFLSGWVLSLACGAFVYGSASSPQTEGRTSYRLEKRRPGSIWISFHQDVWSEIKEDFTDIPLPQTLLVLENLKHGGLSLCFCDVDPKSDAKQPHGSTLCLDLFHGKAAQYLQMTPVELNEYFITGIVYENGIVHTIMEHRSFLHSIFTSWKQQEDCRSIFIDAATQSKRGGRPKFRPKPEMNSRGFVQYGFRVLWPNNYKFVFSIGDVPERRHLENRQWKTLMEMTYVDLPAAGAIYPSWFHGNVLLLCYQDFNYRDFNHPRKREGCYNVFNDLWEAKNMLEVGKYYVNLVDFYQNGFHHTVIEHMGDASSYAFKYFFFRDLQRVQTATRVARRRKRYTQRSLPYAQHNRTCMSTQKSDNLDT